MAQKMIPDRPEVGTIFFGGGTPTLLKPVQLGELISAIESGWGLAADVEITTEANPETIDEGDLERLLAAGVNRISLGMQSAVAHVLTTLDRVHTPGRPTELARAARAAGFERISLDLIYGTPGESARDWQNSIEAVIEAGVDHVSAYSLTIEPGTRMAARVKRGELVPAADDDLADKYLQAEEMLVAAGFTNYETSNWAKDPTSRARHNLAYWKGYNWWGVGPGAHSHVSGVRWWNRKHPRAYAAALDSGELPAQAGETLTDEDRRIEKVMLELRLSDGLDLKVLTEPERAKAQQAVCDGLATIASGRLVLTLRGRLLADRVITDLLS